MNITTIKTSKILPREAPDITQFLDEHITELHEKSVLAVTSKIVAICEGRVVPMEGTDKDALIREESQLYLPRDENKYNVSLTITNNTLVATAGIDESNSNGYYVLWPKDPQKSANDVRKYLQNKFSLKEFGVILTDSKTTPLRWGVTGMGIAHSGFLAFNDHIGKPDIFGRDMEHTMVSVMDSLAAASVYVMGERDEQTPLAVISDIPHIVFQDADPTDDELQTLQIALEDDLYGVFLKNAEWRKGKKHS